MTARPIGSLVAIIVAAVMATPALATTGGEGRPKQGHCKLTMEGDGSFSASIVDASLDEVLAHLTSQTGATIVWMAPAQASRTTTSFRALPLREALARLLARENYLLVFESDRAGTARLDRVLVAPRDEHATTADADLPSPATAASIPTQSFAATAPPPRVRLEAVYDLVDQTGSVAEDSPLRDVLLGVLEGGDDKEVERASTIGLAALPDEVLEFTARTDEALRPLAIDVLTQRARNEPLAVAALNRVANDAGDVTLELTPH